MADRAGRPRVNPCRAASPCSEKATISAATALAASSRRTPVVRHKASAIPSAAKAARGKRNSPGISGHGRFNWPEMPVTRPASQRLPASPTTPHAAATGVSARANHRAKSRASKPPSAPSVAETIEVAIGVSRSTISSSAALSPLTGAAAQTHGPWKRTQHPRDGTLSASPPPSARIGARRAGRLARAMASAKARSATSSPSTMA